jgi:cation/acetate symporter
VNPWAVPAILTMTLLTVAIGAYGHRLARTTSDFLVASRTVSPTWNAAAISGEYLSAASFLGVAGLVLKHGVDMLWYPVGFAAGYLALLLFVAAPLRRSGAFTLPDFCQVRLDSVRLRKLATCFVVFIGWLYLVPQLQGAGLTLRTVTGARYGWGVLLVAVVVAANVTLGGMRSVTFVQAFQYWLKLTALVLPVVFLLLHWQADGRPHLGDPPGPRFAHATTVAFDRPVALRVREAVTVRVERGAVDGRAAGEVYLAAGEHRVAAGSAVVFPARAGVPRVDRLDVDAGLSWLLPMRRDERGLFATYSLILATFLGTMGLPHVLVRFYTNPDGAAARRSTLAVLGLVGLFYLLPTLYGVLGRVYTPQLLLTGRTDAVVLLLPGQVLGGLLGQALGALVAAGAFAAFLSTSSGLLASVAGVLSTDLFGEPGGVASASVRGFRVAAVLGAVVPTVVALRISAMDVSQAVGLAFAVAASSFCPLLVLGIWWRRLTAAGAAAGVLVGGGAAATAVVLTVFGPPLHGWAADLVGQPAAWTVPLAFLVMVGVSLATRSRVPVHVGTTMLRLHAPDTLRL